MARLHEALLARGAASHILCGHKTARGSDSTAIRRTAAVRLVERGLGVVSKRLGLNDIQHVSSFGIRRLACYRDADVLHFHGTHGFFNYLAFPTLTRDKPAVLTLHDLWPISGHCAYPYECERWRSGCGACPHLDTHPAVKRDATRIEWRLKQWVYRRSNFVVVALTRWSREIAAQSLLREFPIREIPHGIDTGIFRPMERAVCRQMLGIPAEKRVIMFAALTLNEPRKGATALLEALRALPVSLRKDLVLLTVGDHGDALTRACDMPSVNLGYVRNDHIKALAYGASDAFVSPTSAETFGLMIGEALACARPVVAFRVAAVPDLVRPGETGYLAELGNVVELRDGIAALLTDPTGWARMSSQCRAVAEREFSLELEVDRHLELYRELLSGSVANDPAWIGS
jgi:glycosyltransferase involved in cell wall biosynthesis